MIGMYTTLFYTTLFTTCKLTEMYWLNWHYSLTDNFDLSLVNVFDKFVIDSKNSVLCSFILGFIWLFHIL